MSNVRLENVSKTYGDMKIIHGVDLVIKEGEFVVFVGPSGCGKSTLLRMIAGLEDITGGHIKIGDKIVNDMPSPQRGIAMVFQSYALYPHMTVRRNMAFGLEISKCPKDEIEERVNNAARILQLEPYLNRMPKELSGGQRQRVAIGRAIVREPKVFLFDEPLSNLDAALRGQTRLEIAKLHSSLGATMIYVTHDQVEAMTLADRIVVLNGGRIEQVGTPLELYSSPANAFVAGFIGGQKMNFIPASSRDGKLQLGQRILPFSVSSSVTKVGIRPEHLHVSTPENAHLSGRVEYVEMFGDHTLIHFETEDLGLITVKVEDSSDIKENETIYVMLLAERLHLFDDSGRVHDAISH